MCSKVLNIIYPGGESGRAMVITVQPVSWISMEDCPVPEVPDVSISPLTPSSVFRISGTGQVTVVAKILARD